MDRGKSLSGLDHISNKENVTRLGSLQAPCLFMTTRQKCPDFDFFEYIQNQFWPLYSDSAFTPCTIGLGIMSKTNLSLLKTKQKIFKYEKTTYTTTEKKHTQTYARAHTHARTHTCTHIQRERGARAHTHTRERTRATQQTKKDDC